MNAEGARAICIKKEAAFPNTLEIVYSFSTLKTEGSPLGCALRNAVSRIGADGRIGQPDASLLLKILDSSPEDHGGLLADADDVLGPFDALPPAARRAIVETVESDDRWRMAGFDLGRPHTSISSLLWRAKDRLRPGGAARSAAEAGASIFRAGPFLGLPVLHRQFSALRGKLARRPRLRDVLARAGVESRTLSVRYARGIEQQPAYRGFWHDRSTHSTVGLIVGLDFVVNSDGYWVLECNMDCGLLAERTAMYSRDPFVENVVDFAATHGYRRLAIVSGATSIDLDMARQYRERGAERKIEVRIFENAFDPRFGHEATVGLPEFADGGTLVLRNRHYRTALDYVVHHKRASSRALRIYREETGDTSFQLPQTSADPRIDSADAADPFPNLVFKLPELDDGEGVVFLKASSRSHARELAAEALRARPRGSRLGELYLSLRDGQGIFQQYVRTPFVDDRRLFKTRAYVLITPLGARFLSTQRTICARPVPAHLPFGLVADSGPYLVSYRPGSRWVLPPPEEEERLRAAALGVARGLSQALEHGFRTAPREQEA